MARAQPTLTLPPGARLLDLLRADEGDALFDALIAEVPWERHHARRFGRSVPMPRLVQFYGPLPYSYSGTKHPPRALPPPLDALRVRVEDAVGQPFNTVLCNLYRDGLDAMGWHRDDDYDHGGHAAIASVSLGAVRAFQLRPAPRGPILSILLEPGSLLILDGEARSAWRHAVPRTGVAVGPRINLTWRHMV